MWVARLRGWWLGSVCVLGRSGWCYWERVAGGVVIGAWSVRYSLPAHGAVGRVGELVRNGGG